ncbi:MAG: arabinan endo-1,5-alpha-L-arabinosidase [Bacteroidota bacterium]
MKTGKFYINIFLLLFIVVILALLQCKKDKPIPDIPPQDPYNPYIADDYSNIADQSNSSLWGSFNLHDPTIIKDGEFFYIFSTDVAYGPNGKCGIMYRRSNDLVQWSFLGWVFNGIPPIPLAFMQANQTGYQQLSLWAPFIIKISDTYRLYYSVPGNNGLKLACIALATSSSPEGPWTDQGIVITCFPADNYNAIDPAVIVDQVNGKHWMTYGSYSAGIFIVELDPLTGKILHDGDKGNLVACRSNYDSAIEGSEILYNPEISRYYLFVSYDWLEDNYNVRVGRADKPEGPYYDINGNDMAASGDNIPMITARYKFKYHAGWQGFGHCGLLRDGTDYYYVSQARLGSNKYIMDLHIHRMVWSSTGWPTISPERYVNVPQTTITSTSLFGKWEHIDLVNTASFNESITIDLAANGMISGVTNSDWQFQDGTLTLSFNSGAKTYYCKVFNEWDWELKKRTLAYSGMTREGISGWGKKVN